MDQLVSQLLPTHRIGNDGFQWWVGQIEGTATDEENNKGGYRFKVRIVGDHPGDPELVSTSDLPWATVMMPVNVPFIPGCLLYTSPSPRDRTRSRMPSSA